MEDKSRRRKQILYLLGSAVVLCGLGSLLPKYLHSNPVKVMKHGNVEVGKQVPGFSALTVGGLSISSHQPPGHFYIHFIHEKLPLICLDFECGDEASQVVAKRGHLMGGSEAKHAKGFGIKFIESNPYNFDTSLMVVADANGRVMAIYKDAEFKHLKEIIEDMRL